MDIFQHLKGFIQHGVGELCYFIFYVITTSVTLIHIKFTLSLLHIPFMSGDYQSIFDIIHPGRIGPVQQIRDQVAVLIVVVIFNIFVAIEVETVTLFIWMCRG
jgi:hypothetical protein